MLEQAEDDDNAITDMHELVNTNKYEIEQMQELISKQNKKQLTQEKRQRISILSDPDVHIS